MLRHVVARGAGLRQGLAELAGVQQRLGLAQARAQEGGSVPALEGESLGLRSFHQGPPGLAAEQPLAQGRRQRSPGRT